MTGSGQVAELLQATHAGPVFGKGVAFGEIDAERANLIEEQTNLVIRKTVEQMHGVLETALPDLDPHDRERHVRRVVTKDG